ncbi:MAG: hypothetical protein UT75_C0005G0016 [Candidatus Yanofskybacteria bacterium GW2011_GWE2_40_11]|uniref:Uncharacterized protein n=1 Tax=Candidatus Yanofskybacteria bacterium GW2011_GWE2_40_11 TaxID=1619033 RepID=A0A0G0QKS8_9BACT|nr:MAG: hypothetical protein UT75_C0005G0016 [Candidatus Yanofskybacteria bacterium GW2011_GWE2_40_11]
MRWEKESEICRDQPLNYKRGPHADSSSSWPGYCLLPDQEGERVVMLKPEASSL